MDRLPDLECDLCIVGSGFAGSVIAAALVGRGAKVLVLEAGGPVDAAQRYQRQAAGAVERVHPLPEHLHVPVAIDSNVGWARQTRSAVGGSSSVWTAWTPRPLAAHFGPSAHDPEAQDWPFGYDTLEPYLGRAEVELGVAGPRQVAAHEPRRSTPYPLPPFARSYADECFAEGCATAGLATDDMPVARASLPYRERPVCCLAGTCGECPTGARYTVAPAHLQQAVLGGARLERDVRATRLELGRGGAIEAITCHRADRSSLRVRARWVVLATGPLETTRLLLLSRGPRHSRGLGNAHDLVGRYLLDHLGCHVWAQSERALQPHRTQTTAVCRAYEVGPARARHAGFMFFLGGGPSATEAAQGLIGAGVYGAEFKRSLRRRVSQQFNFSAKIETRPRATNRVELDERSRDFFGDPGIKLRFDVGDYEAAAMGALWEASGRVAKGMQATIIDEADRLRLGGAGAHVLGGARMSTRAEGGVVDPVGRVHGVPNLYLAGGAVFPNSLGAANPTLTLVALSLRLADHLKEQLA